MLVDFCETACYHIPADWSSVYELFFLCEEWHSDRMMLWHCSYWLSGSGNWYWWKLWTEIHHLYV